MCFNCDKNRHFSNKCSLLPKARKEYVWAYLTLNRENNGDTDNEYQVSEADNKCEDDKESLTPHLDQEYTEIKVTASEFYEDYRDDQKGEQTSSMTVTPLYDVVATSDDKHKVPDRVAVSTIRPKSEALTRRNNHNYWIKSSGRKRERPWVKPEDKECLATWIKVSDLKAWTLWDSGSTTSGITPAYAELANISEWHR